MSVDTNMMLGLRRTVSRLRIRLSGRTAVRRVSNGSVFEAAPDPVTVEVPLPLCRPLNASEQDEVATLARLRGALYSKDA